MFFMKKFTLMTLLCFFALGINAQGQGHGLKVSDAPVDGNWDENTTWYTIQNKKGGYVSTERCNNEGKLLLNNSVAPLHNYERGALWCIVGSEESGYKFYNKAEGTGKALYASRALNSANASFHMEADGDAENFFFDIAKSQQDGYIVIKDYNNGNNYWNDRDQNLAYWNDGRATDDDGSSFTFVEIPSIEHPISLADVDPYKCYTVITPARGGWSVNEAGDRFCSTNDNGWGTTTDASEPRNQFTVLRINDQYYLYSVYAQKFVNSNYTLTEELGDALIFVSYSGSETDKRVVVRFDVPNSYINLGGDKQMVVDSWSAADDGNKVQFTAVGNFDADAAFDALNKMGTYTITYNYYFGTEPIASIQHTGRYKNETYPVAENQFPFVNDTPAGKVTGDEIIDIPCVFQKFKYAQSVSEIYQWYTIGMHYTNPKWINATDDNKIKWETTDSPGDDSSEYLWAFVGDPLTGFKVINRMNLKAIGVGSSNTDIVLVDANSENAIVWTIAKSEAADNIIRFCLTSKQVDNRFLNGQETVSTWDQADAGSTMWAYDAFIKGYYRISHDFGESGTKYIQSKYSSVEIDGKATLLMSEETGAESLFYYDRGSLLSYTAGLYINEDDTNRGLGDIASTTISVATPSGATPLYLRIESPWTMLAKEQNGVFYIDHASNIYINDNSDKFKIHHTSRLPVTISAAKYVSFYAPVAVTIPEGVTAYYLTEEGISDNSVAMTPIEAGETIPAYTGVILHGEQGTYHFTTDGNATANVTGNLFNGTVAKANVYNDAYILGIQNGQVGLYKTSEYESNGYFISGSHKAFLLAEAVGSAALSAGFTFDFEGTTAIEEVVTENSDNIYYDLSGRRVENPTRGIYILGGKKIFVK